MLVLIREQARKGKSGLDAICIRSIEGTGEALLRSIVLPKEQESVAGCEQYGSLIKTLLLGKLHVLQSLSPHFELGLCMGALCVQKWIIWFFADSNAQLIDSWTILVLVIQRVGKSDMQPDIARS